MPGSWLLQIALKDYNPLRHERGFHSKLNRLVKDSLQFGYILSCYPYSFYNAFFRLMFSVIWCHDLFWKLWSSKMLHDRTTSFTDQLIQPLPQRILPTLIRSASHRYWQARASKEAGSWTNLRKMLEVSTTISTHSANHRHQHSELLRRTSNRASPRRGRPLPASVRSGRNSSSSMTSTTTSPPLPLPGLLLANLPAPSRRLRWSHWTRRLQGSWRGWKPPGRRSRGRLLPARPAAPTRHRHPAVLPAHRKGSRWCHFSRAQASRWNQPSTDSGESSLPDNRCMLMHSSS